MTRQAPSLLSLVLEKPYAVPLCSKTASPLMARSMDISFKSLRDRPAGAVMCQICFPCRLSNIWADFDMVLSFQGTALKPFGGIYACAGRKSTTCGCDCAGFVVFCVGCGASSMGES